MELKDIPGQHKIKQYFSRLVKEERLPHALLLTGPSGSGKLALALGLTNLILCKNPENQVACGNCRSCLKTNKNIHPDIHFSYPVTAIKGKERKDIISDNFAVEWRRFLEEVPYGGIEKWATLLDAQDKPFNINVKECNHILKNLTLQSIESDYKIQIIWGANHLGKEGNRLLKLIEEPTDKTIIILIADNQNDLLNTILSRCQIIPIPPFEDESISKHLKSIVEGNIEDIEEIVNLVSGNMDLAIDLFTGEDIQFSEQLLNWLRAAYTGDPEKISAWLDPILKQGKSQQRAFFHYGLHFLKEYSKSLYLGVINSLRLTNEEKNVVEGMQKIVDSEKTLKLIDIFNECLNNLKRNANMRLMLLHQSYTIEKILKARIPALN